MSDFDLVPIVTSPKSAVQVHPEDQTTNRQDQETPMPARQIDQEPNRQHGNGHRAGRNEPRHPESLFAEWDHECCSWSHCREHSAVTRPPEFPGVGGEFEAPGWDEDFPGSRAVEPGTIALLGLAAQSCPRISPPRKVAEWTFT